MPSILHPFILNRPGGKMKFDLGNTFMSGMTAPAHTEVTKRPERPSESKTSKSLAQKKPLSLRRENLQKPATIELQAFARVK